MMKTVAAAFGVVTVLFAAPAESSSILASQIVNGQSSAVSQVSAVGPMTTSHTPAPTLSGETVADYGRLDSFTSVKDDGAMAAYALWNDQFTITGLAPGTSVDFMAHFEMTGTMSVPDDRALAIDPARVLYQVNRVNAWLTGLPGATGPCFTGAIGVPPSGVAECNASFDQSVEARYYLGDRIYYTNTTNGTASTDFLVSLIVGQTYDLRQTISTQDAISPLSFYVPLSAVSSDFTAKFSLTPVGSDYGYATTSGRDYAAAAAPSDPGTIPEPATLVLVGGGLLVSAGVRQRRTRRTGHQDRRQRTESRPTFSPPRTAAPRS